MLMTKIHAHDQAVCGAKAAPTPPDVGDEYSTYRRTLGPKINNTVPI